MHSLFGAGYNRRVMVVATSLQWGFFLPLAYLVGPVLGWGLSAVWIAQVIYRGLQALAFAVIWRRRRWVGVKV